MRDLRWVWMVTLLGACGGAPAADTDGTGDGDSALGAGAAGRGTAVGTAGSAGTGASSAGAGGGEAAGADDAQGSGAAGSAAAGAASQAGSGGTAGADPGSAGAAAPDAGVPAGAIDAGMSAAELDDYTGMCASARWSHVSDACWSCWCETCADTLNVATRRSLEIFECMFEEQLLVDDFLELGCEIDAALAVCVDGDTADWDKLVLFDQCLIFSTTAPAFRACDSECAVPYPGDVCARYP